MDDHCTLRNLRAVKTIKLHVQFLNEMVISFLTHSPSFAMPPKGKFASKKANNLKTVVRSNLICTGIQLWARTLMLSVARCITLFTCKRVQWKPSKQQIEVTEKNICNKQRTWE